MLKLENTLRYLPVILFFLCLRTASADYVADKAEYIEAEWSRIHFELPRAEQAAAYAPLLALANNLAARYPSRVEALYWQAMIKINLAEFENKIAALELIHAARDLFKTVITLDPNYKKGASYVVLGVLYHRVPGWPIAFGDPDEAANLLKKALKINPLGIDANYYYGDFLLSKNEFEQAQAHFNTVLTAPLDPGRDLANNALKIKARIGLANAARGVNSHNPFAELFGM